MTRRLQPSNADGQDGGKSRTRTVKRGAIGGKAPGLMTGYAVARTPVVKTYRGRLPVSGQEPKS